ncbi:hypothetical protein HDU93_005359 [Gonapodya sp. JEL0774]|nr:hypothetical protein HDU93_005359 [Gonapodya sp. JEL0774]
MPRANGRSAKAKLQKLQASSRKFGSLERFPIDLVPVPVAVLLLVIAPEVESGRSTICSPSPTCLLKSPAPDNDANDVFTVPSSPVVADPEDSECDHKFYDALTQTADIKHLEDDDDESADSNSDIEEEPNLPWMLVEELDVDAEAIDVDAIDNKHDQEETMARTGARGPVSLTEWLGAVLPGEKGIKQQVIGKASGLKGFFSRNSGCTQRRDAANQRALAVAAGDILIIRMFQKNIDCRPIPEYNIQSEGTQDDPINIDAMTVIDHAQAAKSTDPTSPTKLIAQDNTSHAHPRKAKSKVPARKAGTKRIRGMLAIETATSNSQEHAGETDDILRQNPLLQKPIKERYAIL